MTPKVKQTIELLREQAEELDQHYGSLEEETRTEAWECLKAGISQCLPILRTAREDRESVWKLLAIIDIFWRRQINLPEIGKLILISLKRLVVYEDWQRVEEYAREGETEDMEMHAMAVKAAKRVCQIEGKTLEVESKLTTWPEGQTEGQCILWDSLNYGSAFGLTAGKHFYETVVLMEDFIVVGWATLAWKERGVEGEFLDEGELVENQVDAIDGQHFLGFRNYFPIGTVLGCLLDVSQKTASFFVNGQPVVCQKPPTFSSTAYHVRALAFSDFPLLYFNFGQVPFKYPPPEVVNLPANRYSLYDMQANATLRPLFDNCVLPCFTDEKQGKVRETLGKLLNGEELSQESVMKEYQKLREEVPFRETTYDWRWLQGIIEMVNIAEERMNVWARLVEMLVEMRVDEWDWEVRDFLVPYSKLQVTADGNTSLYQNLSILFASAIQYKAHAYRNDTSRFSASFTSYLLSAFLSTNDPITASFALIGLQTELKERKEDLQSKEVKEKLAYWKDKFKIRVNIDVWKLRNVEPASNSLTQLLFLYQHFENSLLPTVPLYPATPTCLSYSEASSMVKLSADYRSVRSDFRWQRVRSHLAVDNSLSLASPIFFFEVLLITSGPMKIGWATQRREMKHEEVGRTDFSFGYDGHSRCIWHQGVQFRVRNTRQWQAGDVIGCQLDLANKQFTFYQNGERIEMSGDIYSAVSKEIKINYQMGSRAKVYSIYEKNDSLSSEVKFFISTTPYHAALSLSSYQQCTVNFGHRFFRFPPKCLDIWDFENYSQYLEKEEAKKRPQLDNITLTNSILAVNGSTVTNRDVTISQMIPHFSSLPNPAFSIVAPNECQVCGQSTNLRRRQLENCPHLRFCNECALANIRCSLCPNHC